MKIIGKMIVRHKKDKIHLLRTAERLYRVSSNQYKMAYIGMDIGSLLNN